MGFMLEAVKQNGYALQYASAALNDDREIVLEAVKQNGYALQYASAGLRNGGLREYLNHLKSNVFNVPKQTFIATILFGAKAAPSIPGSSRDSRPCLCDNSRCVLSLLRPSVRVPGSMSLQIKKLIWEYAGVRSGPKWDVIDGACQIPQVTQGYYGFTTGGAAGGVNGFGATNTGAGGAAGVGFAAFGGTQAFGTPGPTSQAGFGFGTLQPQAGATIPEAKSSKEQIQNRRKVTTRKK